VSTTFAWKVRDRSLLHLLSLSLLLVVLLSGFFLVFRISYPQVIQADATPHHLLILDPTDPESLALIHRAQDKSFAILPAETAEDAITQQMPVFVPSYAGATIPLQSLPPIEVTSRHPQLFTAASSVLPAVPRRASALPTESRSAILLALSDAGLSKRATQTLKVDGVALAEPGACAHRTAGAQQRRARYFRGAAASGAGAALHPYRCQNRGVGHALLPLGARPLSHDRD
jgi:hypothetical protein